MSFYQQIGIGIDAKCTLLADLFFYLYEADFIQWLLKKNEKKLSRSFDFSVRYVYWVDRIYLFELGITDTIETDKPA